MRFVHDPKPAPYLNQKDQRRLLAMVGVLSLVIVAAIWAARPQSWYWLVPPDNDTAQNIAKPTNQQPPATSEGHYVDLGAVNQSNLVEKNMKTETKTSKEKPEENHSENLQQQQASSSDLPATWLKSLNDQVVGLRASEADAYYRSLAHVYRLDERFLAKRAREDVLHINLSRNPAQYRGKLLRVRGIAKRILPIPSGKNEYGIKQTYEAWVLTPDSGNDPWRIVASGIDPRLPTGENVSAEVEVTGYFLKMYGYASNGGQSLAPLIISNRIAPRPVVTTSTPSGTGLEPYIIIFAAIVGATTLFTVLLYSRGDRKFQQKLKKEFPSHPTPKKEFFEQLQQTDSKESPFG